MVEATEVHSGECTAFLDTVIYDLMPSAGFEEALEPLPDGAPIAITLVPDLGVWPTVERAEEASARGFEVTPHVAPRFIADRTELEEIVTRLQAAGITDIFVPGGDRDEPIGEFASAYEMLLALEELGYSFEDVGITGYPTGHQTIDDEVLVEAMNKKAPYATYITTQLTLESRAIIDWIAEVRDRGIDLPVNVGIPGVMEYLKLLKLSWRWGIADPLRFIRKTMGIAGFVRTFFESGGQYRPDDMVAEIAPYYDDQSYSIGRARLYTFNQTAATESWRREWIDR